MQTILGANGVIAMNLARALTHYTTDIRLVSRNPKKVNTNDTLFIADLLNREQTFKAVEGSTVVYLTAGLRYSSAIWEKEWPILIRNVIEACQAYNAKLVFFDNVYALGKVAGPMTEETTINPCSKKGEIRARVEAAILDEVNSGNLQALLARAADFYGPDTANSFVTMMVFERLRKGQKAQWLVNPDKKHSLTYTPDAGQATALLGNTPTAFNQIWHLPTDSNALTGREFIAFAAEKFGVSSQTKTFSKWMLQLAGLFVEMIRESNEMLYQYDSDYIFDSSKFEKAFNFKPTTYQSGIEQVVALSKLIDINGKAQ